MPMPDSIARIAGRVAGCEAPVPGIKHDAIIHSGTNRAVLEETKSTERALLISSTVWSLSIYSWLTRCPYPVLYGTPPTRSVDDTPPERHRTFPHPRPAQRRPASG